MLLRVKKNTLYKVTTWLLYNGKVRQEVPPQIIYETNSLMFLVSFPYVYNISKCKKERSISYLNPKWFRDEPSWEVSGYRMNLLDSLQSKPVEHMIIQRATGTLKNQIWNTRQIIWGPPYWRLLEAHTVYMAYNPLAWYISKNWAKIGL